MAKLTILCQHKQGCMGCCGHDFGNKQEIQEAIKKNTLEFQQFQDNLEKFRDRAFPMDLRKGVCRNLIQINTRILCPLHPLQNNGKDLREGHCDIDHLCITAKRFSGWDPKRRERFLNFLKQKKLDLIDYSLGMDQGNLMEEFEKENYPPNPKKPIDL